MPKDKKTPKVDLTLLKRLVTELDSALENAEQIAANKNEENVQDYVVEMAKATGIAAGVLQEATMLIGDINQLVRINTMSAGKEDPLGSLLSVLKGGPGNLPGAN
jgi:hypothetical protein